MCRWGGDCRQGLATAFLSAYSHSPEQWFANSLPPNLLDINISCCCEFAQYLLAFISCGGETTPKQRKLTIVVNKASHHNKSKVSDIDIDIDSPTLIILGSSS